MVTDEQTYKRLISEKSELEVKFDKLKNFMSSNVYFSLDSYEKYLLGLQCNSMLNYLFSLDLRIKLYCKSFEGGLTNASKSK